MADFIKAYNHTAKIEGGYVNDPDDPGGETYKGITKRDYPHWKGWQYIVNGKVQNPAEVERLCMEFYKKEFWDSFNGDLIKWQHIAEEIFDTGVNMGRGIAEGFVQMALNLTNLDKTKDLEIDGEVGPKTIAVLNAHPNPEYVFKLLNVLQGARYAELAQKNSKLRKFLKGWLNNRVTLNFKP